MPTLYICYVALYRCGHHDIAKLQIEKAASEIKRLFYVWNKMKTPSQDPMVNSVVAALAHPVLHGIRIPIYQTKQLEGEPHTRSPRHKDSVAFAMWLSTAVGTTTSYCVAHHGFKLRKLLQK